MDRLPAEIHGLIFSEACSDGGHTGRSLALVSKTIRAISAPYALHSVALYGSSQLAAFAAFLAQRDPEESHIRHLFLTDRRRVWMERGAGEDQAAWVTNHMKQEQHLKDSMRRADAEPIAQIMRAAAPHLRTLAFLLFDLYDEHTLPVHFPVLRELTLHASSLAWRGAPSLSACETLRRLHVIQDFSFPRAAVKTVARLAPRLTHLRISRITISRLSTGDILAGLQRMLEEHAGPADAALAAALPKFPSSLTLCIVQMGQQARYDNFGVLQILTSPTAYELKDLALRDTRRRIVMLHPTLWDTAAFASYETDIEYYVGVRMDWEERLVGEEGAWALDPADIFAMNGADEE